MNGILTRDMLAKRLGLSHDNQRNIDEIYGWDGKKDFKFFYGLATQTAIGARLVFDIPRKCWANGFTIEGLDEEISILKTSECFDGLLRADQLNRMYKFSIAYVGVPDGLDPSEPIGTINPAQLNDIYVQPYSYNGVQVNKTEQDKKSPRFGSPVLYTLYINSEGNTEKDTQRNTMVVHYSRVIHIAEMLLDSNLEGLPYLKPIFKPVLSLDKTCGGSAEAYFRNARGKYGLELDPAFASEILHNETAKDKIKKDAEDFTNDWQDFIIAMGIKVTQFSTSHASPKDTADAQIQQVCAYTGLTKRILIGEGAGQLANSEDRMTLGVIINDRQGNFCSKILTKFFAILKSCNALKYEKLDIVWGLEQANSEKEQVDIADKRASALNQLTKALESPALGNLSDESVNSMIKIIMGADYVEEKSDEYGED